MKTSYLVIWQLGTNINTRTETALDVMIYDDDSAQEKYDNIIYELEEKKKIITDDNITIISVNKL